MIKKLRNFKRKNENIDKRKTFQITKIYAKIKTVKWKYYQRRLIIKWENFMKRKKNIKTEKQLKIRKIKKI